MWWPQDAEDLVQETALQALRRPPARPGPVSGWLISILHHFAGKQRRSWHRRQWHEPRAPQQQAPLSPDRIAEHRDTVARLHAAFMAVAKPFRGTLLLRFFEDMTPTQIAAQTGVPLATVKSRLQCGLQLLRKALDTGNTNWRAALGAVFDCASRLPITAIATLWMAVVADMGASLVVILNGLRLLRHGSKGGRVPPRGSKV